jgi:hypothetical protein
MTPREAAEKQCFGFEWCDFRKRPCNRCYADVRAAAGPRGIATPTAEELARAFEACGNPPEVAGVPSAPPEPGA